MMRYVTGFVRFWYDFIVGDSIVLAIGAPLILGLVFLLDRAGRDGVAEFVLPIAVVGTLITSLVLKTDS